MHKLDAMLLSSEHSGLQVPHSAVALGVIHCEVASSHMFYAANGSLVGLCCLAEKVVSTGAPVLLSQSPICPCVGFGTYAGTTDTINLLQLMFLSLFYLINGF